VERRQVTPVNLLDNLLFGPRSGGVKRGRGDLAYFLVTRIDILAWGQAERDSCAPDVIESSHSPRLLNH
jgi:hypothetical protein